MAKDYVRLIREQKLADPLGVVPAGVIGWVINTGPAVEGGGALVRFRDRYPAVPVKLSDLERARWFDLMPSALQMAMRAVGRWFVSGTKQASAALIGAAAGIGADRLVIHFFGK